MCKLEIRDELKEPKFLNVQIRNWNGFIYICSDGKGQDDNFRRDNHFLF